MEKQNQTLYKFVLKYGFLVAVVPILYNAILLILGLHLDYKYYGEGIGAFYGETRLFIMPIILFVAIYRYRKINSEYLKLIHAVKIGIVIFLIASVLIISYNLIFRLLIEPDFTSQFYGLNRSQIFQELVECCNYSETDLENHERTNGSLWNSLISNVILDCFFTFFFSLIIGLILKKKRDV